MQIAVINKKGGVGKTPFAFSLAKDLGLFLQSNDNSCIEQIYPNMAKISSEVQDLDNCVYDFGGFVASGVLDIIKKCDCVIVPCLPNNNSFIRTINTIDELKEINENLVILATGYKNEKGEEFLENELEERYPTTPIFYFKNSMIVDNAINYGQSFEELYKESPLSKRSYSNFYREYKRLLKFIKNKGA